MAAPLPNSWRAPSGGKWRSWLPQPSSAGCAPSPTKPSIDHVLMNSSRCLGIGEACVSRSATWMTLTPRRWASAAHSAPALRLARFPAGGVGDVQERRFDEVRDEARIGAVRHERGRSIRGAARSSSACRAARNWSAATAAARDRYSRRATARAGIEIEHALAAAQLDERDRGHLDRDVEQEIAGAQQRLEDAA